MSVSAAPARVLIADDYALVREGLKVVLDRQEDLQVTVEAIDGADAVGMAVTSNVDLAILDVAMPKLTGLQAVREIRRHRANLPVLLLSTYASEQYFFQAVAAGAAGYVLKSQADTDLVAACRAALQGLPFIYPSALSTLMRRYLERTEHGGRTGRWPLTVRESEVVKLIAEGHSSRDIADLLVVSVKTVERHRANILDKLGMRDRVEVTRYAIRAGLIQP